MKLISPNQAPPRQGQIDRNDVVSFSHTTKENIHSFIITKNEKHVEETNETFIKDFGSKELQNRSICLKGGDRILLPKLDLTASCSILKKREMDQSKEITVNETNDPSKYENLWYRSVLLD